MKEIDQKSIIFFTLVFFGLAYYCTNPYIIDDSYITLRCTQHWIEGKGLYFNTGQNVYTITNPLWAYLIGWVAKTGVSLKVAMLGTAAVTMYFFYVSLIVWLGSYFKPLVATIAASILLSNTLILGIGMSGMETPLYILLIMWAIIFAEQKKYALSWVIAGIALFVRTDAFLLAVVLGMFQLFEKGWQKTFKSTLIYITFIAAYLLFGYLNYDTVIPNSVIRKTGLGNILSVDHITSMLSTLYSLIMATTGHISHYSILNPQWIILPLITVVFISKTFKINRVLVFSFLVSMAMVFMSFKKVKHGWYFIPPLLGIAYPIATFLKPHIYKTKKIIAICIFIIISLFYNYKFNSHLRQTYHYAQRELVYQAVSQWSNRWMTRNAKMACVEIGALGYYLRSDIELLDLYGLSRIKEDRALSRVGILEKYKPACLVYNQKKVALLESVYKDFEQYTWQQLGGKMVGVRKELIDDNNIAFDQLTNIYKQLKTEKGL